MMAQLSSTNVHIFLLLYIYVYVCQTGGVRLVVVVGVNCGIL